jgi:hypothetical protein
VSRSTILNQLRESLSMKSFHLGWMLHQLTEDL